MLFRKKIPCYVLIFDQVEIIRRTLEFLVKSADRLDLIIMENPTANTPKIRKIVEKLGKQGLIKRYYLFDENITNNTFDIVMTKEMASIKKSPYVIITDGDMVSDDKDWLDEELGIMKRHTDIFACGITLDSINLPLATFPDAKDWIPPDKQEYPDFYEARTGAHLLIFRGAEFSAFMDWKNKYNHYLVDSNLYHFCYEELHKKWARTKKAKALHLTWDLYLDKNHPYTVMKLNKTHQETWYHRRQAGYTLIEF